MGLSKAIKKVTKSVTKNIIPTAAGAGAGFLLGGPAGAAIGAGAGFGLGYLQDEQTKAQNKANQQAINAANAYDMYTWDLANQYNNPKAQVQRLIDAGFNPYTQGAISAGNASGTASSNGVAEQAISDRFGLGMKIAQAGVSLATAKQNLANLKLQNKLDQMTLVNKPSQIAHQLAQQSIATEIARHNLEYARKHKKPVGTSPGFWENLYNLGSVMGEDIFDGTH